MSQPIKMKVQIATLPDPRFETLRGWLEQNIEVTVPDGFLTGGIVTLLPTQNIGPVLYLNQWYVWDSVTSQYIPQSGIGEIGAIKIFPSTALDATHYVVCNGAAYPRISPYDVLYSKIGTTFGNGDGSTTFNVPNMPLVLQVLLSGQVTLASGVGVINSSLITATSMVNLDVASSSGTIGGQPYAICAAGSAAIKGGASDNSTYNYIVYGVIAGLVYAIRCK